MVGGGLFELTGMPLSLSTDFTEPGEISTAVSDTIIISSCTRLSGSWDMQWCENSPYYPDYQQGYGEIIADGVSLFNTGNCTYSNRDSSDSGNFHHHKFGTFQLDISSYNNLKIQVTVTKAYSNWAHQFTISNLVWY